MPSHLSVHNMKISTTTKSSNVVFFCWTKRTIWKHECKFYSFHICFETCGYPMLMETFLSLSQDGRPPSDSASRQNSSRLKTWKIHKGRCEKIANFFDTRENAGMINWRELSIFEWLSMSPTSAWWTCNRAVVLGWSRHVPMLGEVSGSRKQEPRPRSPSRAGFKEMSNCPMCEDMACVSRYECWWYENSNFSLCTIVFKCWNLFPPLSCIIVFKLAPTLICRISPLKPIRSFQLSSWLTSFDKQ